MSKFRRAIVIATTVIALLTLVTLVALSFRSPDAKTPKLQNDWSRSVRVGETLWSQPPALAVSDDGRRIHLVWAGAGVGGIGVNYLQMNTAAQPVAREWLGPLGGTPQSVQVVLDQQNRPHIFAIGQTTGQSAYRVAYASLSEEGAPRVPLQPLSPADTPAAEHTVTLEPDGTLTVFWLAESEHPRRGLYVTRLDAEGHALGYTQQLIAGAVIDIATARDRQNRLHMIWGEPFEGPTGDRWRRLRYALYADDALQPADGVFIEQTDAPPRLALDAARLYVFWGKQVRGGSTVGTGYTRYVSFPIGNPSASTRLDLRIPFDGEPPSLPYVGTFNLKTLAKTERPSVKLTTDLIHSPAPAPGQRGQVGIATMAALNFGLNQRVLPTLVVLRDGQPIGYQPIAYNERYNQQPALAADQAGNLYAAWITGSTETSLGVYYAATTDAAHTQLDAMDLTDLVFESSRLIFSIIGGLALLPFLPLILLPAAIILVGYTIFGQGSGALDSFKSYLVLFLICLAYWLTKEIVLGAVLMEPFFARTLTGTALTTAAWITQLVIAGVAIAITGLQISSKRIESIFGATLVFVACDIALTLIIAGPTLAIRG